jgi:hypothetical protein
MLDFQTEMNRVVAGFVADITELARRAAINTLESALGRSSGRARGSLAARGGKRSSEALDGLRDQFVAFVTKNPGLRIEQIGENQDSCRMRFQDASRSASV